MIGGPDGERTPEERTGSGLRYDGVRPGSAADPEAERLGPLAVRFAVRGLEVAGGAFLLWLAWGAFREQPAAPGSQRLVG